MGLKIFSGHTQQYRTVYKNERFFKAVCHMHHITETSALHLTTTAYTEVSNGKIREA